ncbi:hypothetical protein OBV_34720 [Oscillibacter valericigenes Sjm18-20]|nr:hypothetical protein OBV_34720 [Oscillibacter valericigenes Sjm18-20]
MGFGKFLLGVGGAIGAVVLAPVAIPAAAAVGAAAAATAATAGAAVAATVATAGAAVASTAVGSAAIGAATAVGSTAAAACTAVAGSAVGSAAIGAMTAVGTGVGTAAGAVGLTSVATVAGTSAGAAAVGTIATSAAIGAGTAVSSATKMMEASDILESANRRQTRSKEKLDQSEKQVNIQLEQLGKCKVSIWSELDEYIKTCSLIRNIPEKGALKLDGEVCFDELNLAQIQGVTLSMKDILGGSVASLTGGQLVGLATSTGFTSIATASTGTAIAGLHGIAATNASLAALGGGALNVGGLGMAGGAVVANALAFAPAMAIGGLFINGKASKSLDNAHDVMKEVRSYSDEVGQACKEIGKLENLCVRMRECLEKIEPAFSNYLKWLKDLVATTTDFKKFDCEQQKSFFITFKLAKILTDLTCTQLIDDKTNKIEKESVEKKIKEQGTEYDKVMIGTSV